MGNVKTDFLFATPSFVGGAASVFAVSGYSHEYNNSRSGREADERALRSDWEVVGQDIAISITIAEAKFLKDGE